jgi:hypothetical protein
MEVTKILGHLYLTSGVALKHEFTILHKHEKATLHTPCATHDKRLVNNGASEWQGLTCLDKL